VPYASVFYSHMLNVCQCKAATIGRGLQ